MSSLADLIQLVEYWSTHTMWEATMTLMKEDNAKKDRRAALMFLLRNGENQGLIDELQEVNHRLDWLCGKIQERTGELETIKALLKVHAPKLLQYYPDFWCRQPFDAVKLGKEMSILLGELIERQLDLKKNLSIDRSHEIGPLLIKDWATVFGIGRVTASNNLMGLQEKNLARPVECGRGWYVARSELTEIQIQKADELCR